jgi:hypothetical protein
VVERPKQGFALPVDSWVTPQFRSNLREVLLDPRSPVGAYLSQETYLPWVTAFCNGDQHPSISRLGLYQRATMLLALELWLGDSTRPPQQATSAGQRVLETQ